MVELLRACVAAEVAILASFVLFQTRVLKQPLLWNHVIGFAIVLIGVLIVLDGPLPSPVVFVGHSVTTPAVHDVEETELVIDRSPPPSPPPSSPLVKQLLSPVSPPPCPILPPIALSSSMSATASPSPPITATRLTQLVEWSEYPRQQALRELAAGQKRGHWIWRAFPTLPDRGGDINSYWTGADLTDIAEADAYAANPQLRAALLLVLRTATTAFAAHSDGLGPYHVLDEGFGRRAQGQWIGGPVDAFKAWCSCTLFGALARRRGDGELAEATSAVLRAFEGGAIVYTAGGEGTAGYVEEVASRRNVLDSAGDPLTRRLLS